MPATTKMPRARAKTLRVAVLMGGVSSEREVSLRSGKAVSLALSELGHAVSPIDVTRDDREALAGLPAEIDAAFIALHGRFGEDGGVQRRLEALRIPYIGS